MLQGSDCCMWQCHGSLREEAYVRMPTKKNGVVMKSPLLRRLTVKSASRRGAGLCVTSLAGRHGRLLRHIST